MGGGDFPDMYAWARERAAPEGECGHIRQITPAHVTCNGCNMAMRDLPDMYARSPRAEGIHIGQIINGHVTSIMYHFVPIVTTPVVLIP